MSNITIRFPEKEKKMLDRYARYNKMSRGKVLRELFKKEMEKHSIELYSDEFLNLQRQMIQFKDRLDIIEMMTLIEMEEIMQLLENNLNLKKSD